MTDLLTNPIDTGEIPAPGETLTRLYVATPPGETTLNLAHAIQARRPDATGEIPALADTPLGLAAADLAPVSPAAYSPEPGEPPRPLPVPPPVPGPPPPAAAETERLSLLGSLGDTWPGTDPEPPRPLPNPGPPPTPGARHAWHPQRAEAYPVVKPRTRKVCSHRRRMPSWKIAVTAVGALLVAEALAVASILAAVL